jgi:catechol 2,3-dioxygenase
MSKWGSSVRGARKSGPFETGPSAPTVARRRCLAAPLSLDCAPSPRAHQQQAGGFSMKTAVVGDRTGLGAVHLDVTDLDRALAIWRDVVGLDVLKTGKDTAEFGVGGETLVVLNGGATSPIRGPTAGLFHVAIEVPTRGDLARVAARILRSGLKHTALDHLTTDSLYVTDPDGIDIEVFVETPGRGRIEIIEGNPRAVPNDGSPHSGRDPLDIAALAKEAEGDDHVRLGVGTRVGHLHLRSRAPERLLAFYGNVVGLLPFMNSRALSMYDAGTPSRPHLLAFNSWGGPAIQDRMPGCAGLASFEIVVASDEELALLRQRLGSAGAEAMGEPDYLDPDRNRFRLSSAREVRPR